MIIGIDLGTTNSLVSIWQNGKSVLIPNVHGQVLTPSVIGLDDEGRVLVGLAARERLQTHPERTVALFKRYMGSQHEALLGQQRFYPEELSALVLKSLKEDAERYLGQTINEAVITVPAYFSDAQRKATRIAGELAGLKVERLLNEPTAAALAYGLHQKDNESTFLVFDLGGGTFDVSVLELFEGVMEVRASAGDNFLGGEDFANLLIERFLETEGQAIAAWLASRTGDPASRQLQQALRKEAERVKRALSNTDEVEFVMTWQDITARWLITEASFNRLVEPLLNRIRLPLERALRDSRLRLSDLDEVVLAGGASRMPIIRKMVARLFGRLPAIHMDPDQIVALGAAVQAGLKMRDVALDEIVMTDVSPYTLGIETSRRTGPDKIHSGVYLPIIERNTVVPVSRSENVFTMHDNQKAVMLKIYQGESSQVRDNVFLGDLTIDVPQRPAGEVELSVRFTYTVDGLLEAECIVLATGETTRLVIEKNPGELTTREVNERLQKLATLKIHPRDQLESTVLINRADRLYQEHLGDQRQMIGDNLLRFRSALDTQDPRTIADARKGFKRFLDTLEGEILL